MRRGVGDGGWLRGRKVGGWEEGGEGDREGEG